MYARLVKAIVFFVSLHGAQVMAIEEAKYAVVVQEGKFEVRDYDSYLLAEVTVDGSFEEAGNKGFRYLFKYISGENRPQTEIAMTAPVSQRAAGEEIAMTAPVSQSGSDGRYVVSFMMPASYTLETIPQPADEAVSIRQVPGHRMAVARYSGTWSRANYEKNKQALDAWVAEKGFAVIGEPVWARYNSPFSLWFLRRNEVLLPIAMN